MKVALIGASGFVGTEILNELVKRGHTVTVMVLNLEKVKAQELVSVVKVNVQREDVLMSALKGHDVIVNSFTPCISWNYRRVRPFKTRVN